MFSTEELGNKRRGKKREGVEEGEKYRFVSYCEEQASKTTNIKQEDGQSRYNASGM